MVDRLKAHIGQQIDRKISPPGIDIECRKLVLKDNGSLFRNQNLVSSPAVRSPNEGNESHEVTSAASAMYNLATTVDLSRIVTSSSTQNAGTEFFPLDKENLIWQEEMIKARFFILKIMILYKI